MAKKKEQFPENSTSDLFREVWSHYQDWKSDNDIRRTRVNGWDDVTDAYWGELPEEWPYDSRVVDPRIRTTIIDKDARLINSRLRGRLVPREGGDVIGARFNNAILDYQWDNANKGGSMESKLQMCSQDTRLYATKFAYVPWLVEKDAEGNVVFEGNEFVPWDIRDCGIDFKAQNIKDAKWFQHREWIYIDDLIELNKSKSPGAQFKNLGEIKGQLANNQYNQVGAGGDKRSKRYVSREFQLKGLEDRLGRDPAFPVVEIVTEYRKDKWITFAPTHGMIIREIKNPYKHGKIPVVQLKYYPLGDDPHGESEVEPVLPLWRAIQATVCGYLDEMNIKMRPPVKILEGQARIETIVYGPEAQWIVNRQDAVEEMRSDSGSIINYFQSSYQSLVSAFNVAMGDLSQGTSAVDPFGQDKTATEIRAVQRQQNVRDQRNQQDLAQFIKDIMGMWVSNNQQFLFSDSKKKKLVMRIVGSEQFEYFQRMGLDEMTIPDESMQLISETITMQDGNISDDDISQMIDAAQVPLHPVGDDMMEKKMEVSELGDSAKLTILPEDIMGTYDYVADVKSMASGSDAELQNGRLRAIEMLQNPQTVQQLQVEGWRPKVKDLQEATLEDLGLKDASRFFEKVEEQMPQGMEQGMPQGMPTEQPAQPDLQAMI